jgi:CRP/FNR family nitrogen fixation transcriptional regulator
MQIQNAPFATMPRHNPRPQAATHDLTDSIEMMGAPMVYARNSEVFGEEEAADYVYKVVSGAVRTYNVLDDGRRQIGAFYFAGDFFGLESGEAHTFSAEAVIDSKILVIKRSALLTLVQRDGEVAQQLWSTTSRELRRVQDHVLLLIKTAEERVVDFLLQMAKRMRSGNKVSLPMSRQDIADYLGLTIETVSRTMTHLEVTHAIELPNARTVLLRNSLGRLAA